MNLARNLESSAFFFPERPAISEGEREITYREFNEKANRIATALISMGIRPGDFIGLCTPNSTEWLIFYFGVIKAGAVAVTFSSLLSPEEFRLLIDHSKPRFLLTTDSRLDDIKGQRGEAGIEKVISPQGDVSFEGLLDKGVTTFKAVERNRNDTAAILYTGGTTGIPKGVMLTHENINTSSHNVSFSERSTEKDRALCFLPFNHVFGQIHIMNATVMSGGCLELLPSFDMERVLWLIKTGRVTKLFAVPTVYARFLTLKNLEELMVNVRYCFSAAASLPVEIVRQWKERTGINICEGYGLTESASAVTYNHYYRHVVGSIGGTVPGVEVQIRDLSGNPVEDGKEGEICILGHNIMKGYLNNPGATKEAFWEDGWFRSGDIGYFDRDGYLYIVDRLKDLIITGGENVYPREVEEAIYTKQEVEECAVIGLPDKEWGERVVAIILLKPHTQLTGEEMKAYLKTRLSPFKVPKEYHFVKEMPKSPAGKILKRELKKGLTQTKN
ncbi:MAG: long-chain fatty acid--CoA ligase [Syntrophorhabdaceae bacterium]|nr:long-chain fatty acid--CoA ligase [Syntrophorhabdaceae bacterium]